MDVTDGTRLTAVSFCKAGPDSVRGAGTPPTTPEGESPEDCGEMWVPPSGVVARQSSVLKGEPGSAGAKELRG